MRLFFDCEWSDAEGRQLISLALLDSSAQHRFYVERDPLPNTPSDFVREVVYPLLDRGATTLPDLAFTSAPRTFLAGFEDPLILADAGEDFMLLSHALGGFGQPGWPPAPPWRPMLVTFGDVLMRIEDYFDARPEARTRRHHAMVDAEALRWAFETIGGAKS
ncbi:hypothetical protein [Marilutibacter maris]|nr:hypothetical protein [Lysobacter maris]